MEKEIGRVRLYSMRILFFLTFIGLAPATWPQVFSISGGMEPVIGVAISFWAAISMLAILGILYPLKMLPLLFLQLLYKSMWLLSVGLPAVLEGEINPVTKELLFANGIGVVLDVLVIPWIYVFKRYFYKPIW